jgi:hypothetical protein
MKIVLGVVLLLLAAATSYAAPNVSAISGQISDGQQVVIQGSGFGQNSLNIEWLGGKNGAIESGTVGQAFSRTNWENNWGWANLIYANDQKESGLQSLKVSPDSAVNWNGIMSYNLTSPVNAGGGLFISYWVRKITSGSGQWKMLRISGNDTVVDGSQEVVLFNWLGTGSSQLVIDPGQGNDQTTWVNDVYPTADNTWYRMDLYLQASSLNTSNGSITINRITPGSAIAAQTISGLKTHLTGYSWNHVIWQNYVGNGMTNGTFWFDDVYIQNGSQARVELGDSSTWSACTIRQIQFPTSWADGSITVQLNQGSFSSGANAYLYAVDSNGNVNSNGYPVTIGASGSGGSGTGSISQVSNVRATQITP